MNQGIGFSRYLGKGMGTEEGEGENLDFAEVNAFLRDDFVFIEVVLDRFPTLLCSFTSISPRL